jgi:hypothetical protein
VLHSKARFGWGLRTEAIKPRALDFGSCKGDYPDLSQVYIMETFGFLPFRASKAQIAMLIPYDRGTAPRATESCKYGWEYLRSN